MIELADIFAILTRIKDKIPNAPPQIGIIQEAGSLSPTRSAAAAPSPVPTVAANTSPNILGQKAALDVLQILARPPMFGHHEKPAPRLSSKAIRKFNHGSSKGSKADICAISPQPTLLLIMKIRTTMTTKKTGTTMELMILIRCGPLSVTNQQKNATISPNKTTYKLDEKSLPVM